MTSGMFLIGFLAGACLAAGNMLGLWLTVKRLSNVRNPGLLVAESAVARLLILTAAFYGLAQVDVFALIGGALAFLAARLAVLGSVRIQPAVRGTEPGSECA